MHKIFKIKNYIYIIYYVLCIFAQVYKKNLLYKYHLEN
jgi:hypothetical protein